MPDTMMIKPNKALAGAPRRGEVGEVDYEYGKMLVDQGHAIDVTELHARLSLTPEERYLNSTKPELKKELGDRGLSTAGDKTALVKRLLEDDEAPEDPLDDEADDEDVDYRSSVTGRYVTEETAERHPRTTVAETDD